MNDEYLLRDRTTGRNILLNGIEITSTDGIIPRCKKPKETQKKRTKAKAEVFTPLWVVCQMNNTIDDDCLYKDAFFTMDGKNWARTKRVNIEDWQSYVLQKRLEITCGEAPFICTPYDPETGEPIPVQYRVGFLDRKLRIVRENNGGYEWMLKAFKCTYGYEYAGDSLYLARKNLLQTFTDNIDATEEQIEEIAEVITYNIIQMNGLTNTIPDTDIKAKIMDWDTNELIEFESIGGLKK